MFVDEPVEHLINDVFEVGEEPIDRVSRRRSIEATAEPDEGVLEFSRDGTNVVDILGVAVQECSEEFWWVMVSCSPPASGAENVYAGTRGGDVLAVDSAMDHNPFYVVSTTRFINLRTQMTDFSYGRVEERYTPWS
jgi:hypothetical protein